MENKNINSLIDGYIKNISPEMKKIIDRIDWDKKIEHISAKHKLDKEGDETFYIKTWFTILGIIETEEYYSTLENDTSLGEVDRISLKKETNESILYPLQDLIQDRFNQDNSGIDTQRNATKEQVNISKPISTKVDPYLEPIEESDTI